MKTRGLNGDFVGWQERRETTIRTQPRTPATFLANYPPITASSGRMSHVRHTLTTWQGQKFYSIQVITLSSPSESLCSSRPNYENSLTGYCIPQCFAGLYALPADKSSKQRIPINPSCSHGQGVVDEIVSLTCMTCQ